MSPHQVLSERAASLGPGESVLVDGPWVLCTPGGKEATLAALDKRTGRVVWKSPIET